MADIEYMIKLPEESDIRWHFTSAIVNGTPLPKGHGDLIDRKEVLKNMEFEEEGYCDFDCYKPITDALTIIGADKTESEE